MNEWIKVTDRLPDDESIVFAFDAEYELICICKYIDNIWYNMEVDIEEITSAIGQENHITHWMPINDPEKPIIYTGD